MMLYFAPEIGCTPRKNRLFFFLLFKSCLAKLISFCSWARKVGPQIAARLDGAWNALVQVMCTYVYLPIPSWMSWLHLAGAASSCGKAAHQVRCVSSFSRSCLNRKKDCNTTVKRGQTHLLTHSFTAQPFLLSKSEWILSSMHCVNCQELIWLCVEDHPSVKTRVNVKEKEVNLEEPFDLQTPFTVGRQKSHDVNSQNM